MTTIRALFMQSQSFFGSDSMIHSLYMRYLNREHIDVHAACNNGFGSEKPASLTALEKIPNVRLRPTYFGPTANNRSKAQVAVDAITSGVPLCVSLASLAKYIKEQRIDIIHCTEKPRDAFYGLLLARATGARCVIHLHVKVENWISPMTRWAMSQADCLVGVSEFVAKSIMAYGYSTAKIYHIVNSLDLTSWSTDVDGGAIRSEFGVAPDVPLMAIISRLFPWKGHTELIKALSIVREQVPNFKLLVVGEDDPRATPGGGNYSEQLKRLVAELHLQEHVIFTGFRRDVREILAACDIFTMPSYEEPCAVAYLEAMAMCKPVIALMSGGTPELVAQGRAGLLAEPWDIPQLAANITTMLREPQLRIAMGEYGRKSVETRYTPRRMADELETVYQRVVSSSPKPKSSRHTQKSSLN